MVVDINNSWQESISSKSKQDPPMAHSTGTSLHWDEWANLQSKLAKQSIRQQDSPPTFSGNKFPQFKKKKLMKEIKWRTLDVNNLNGMEFPAAHTNAQTRAHADIETKRLRTNRRLEDKD